MKRNEFSNKTKLDAWTRAKGRCEECGVKIVSGAEYDHRIACGLDCDGGDNSLDNCVVLCGPCHSVKTAKTDIPRIAKTKRLMKRAAGIRKTQSRPLPGTRESGVRKRMNGQVERWHD